MGCNRSRIYHDNELGIDHKDLVLTTFETQKDEIIHDLDTDNDQKGKVAVDCIFRPTREIYGQRAIDMAEQTILWSKYGIKFHKRPFPHDFPAFAHEKPAAELAQLNRFGISTPTLLPINETQMSKITQSKTNPKETSSIQKIRRMNGNENIEDVAMKD